MPPIPRPKPANGHVAPLPGTEVFDLRSKMERLAREESECTTSLSLDELVKIRMETVADATALSEGPDAQVERADTLREEWGVEYGQLWYIPSNNAPGESHRILCGDSRVIEDLGTLMDGASATLVFTDPPYGVAIGAKNRMLNSFQKAGRNLSNIVDDEMEPDDLKVLLTKAFTNLKSFMSEDCSVLVTVPQGGELGMMMLQMMSDVGLPVRHTLIWRKNAPTFSMGRLDYDYQHEPIFFTWGKTHKKRQLGPHRTSVWHVDKPRASPDHPTMKPVELPANGILNHTDLKDHVLDIYCGTGPTIVAAEMTGRIGHGMEIEPKYVAVCLQRLKDMGLQPYKAE